MIPQCPECGAMMLSENWTKCGICSHVRESEAEDRLHPIAGSPSLVEWQARARKSHAEMMAMKERLMKLADSFAEDAKNHRKLADGASSETTKICHLSAWDAYKNAERRVMDAVHHEAAF